MKIGVNARKSGPQNEIQRKNRRDSVYELFFEKCKTKVEIAKSLGVSRNTIESDVKFLLNEIGENLNYSSIIENFAKQIELMDVQRSRLFSQLEELSPENRIKVEKMILDSNVKTANIYSKILPNMEKNPIISEEEFSRVIRDICLGKNSEFRNYMQTNQIHKAIYIATYKDQSYINQFFKMMLNRGLEYFHENYDQGYMVFTYKIHEFAYAKNIITKTEINKINKIFDEKMAESERLEALMIKNRRTEDIENEIDPPRWKFNW